jgi:predicted flap endonuclease-1-like 5' DNA nuclease
LIEVSKSIVAEIGAFREDATPQLVLKKHCTECEFQSDCPREAVKKDDLSLLSGMSEKERKQLQGKGIFTVTQLSYTFRPRRKLKHSISKSIKSSFALKALAIRENKIHIARKLRLNLTGTPVFLDVEGIPDSDFYYLIGIRVKIGNSYTQHSFWANNVTEEKKIWFNFLQVLRTIDNPQLIYYGSYEAVFLKRMKDRYGHPDGSSDFLDQLIVRALNILSVTYAQIYFPTFSNGLKDIAQYLGFKWSDSTASGFNSLIWRDQWESLKIPEIKEKLITYNIEDCQALEKITEVIAYLGRDGNETTDAFGNEIIDADLLKREYPQRFGKINLVLPELDFINKAAYWDYQRDKIYLRSNQHLKSISRKSKSIRVKALHINKTIQCSAHNCCQKCGAAKIFKYGKMNRLIYDLKFGNSGIKHWIVKYSYNRYICWECRSTFVSYEKSLGNNKFGAGLTAFVIYHVINLKIPQSSVAENIRQLFKLPVTSGTMSHQKALAANFYMDTYNTLLDRILSGGLIHADETKANIKGKDAYVWVFTNMEEVVYVYTETREGNFLTELLKGFKGVLVSDFYAAYDSINCPQQKCLIHLMRDLNDDMFKQPFNEELKELLKEFAILLRPMIETVDRFGLKSRNLRKHKIFVDRFYQKLSKCSYQSEIVLKYKKRFEKFSNKLFTFLDYDAIPWNNNNAEHAVKSFVKLRNIIGGTSTEKGVRDYLTLLSICETCKYKSVNFLNFLRSGQKDIDIFNKTN